MESHNKSQKTDDDIFTAGLLKIIRRKEKAGTNKKRKEKKPSEQKEFVPAFKVPKLITPVIKNGKGKSSRVHLKRSKNTEPNAGKSDLTEEINFAGCQKRNSMDKIAAVTLERCDYMLKQKRSEFVLRKFEKDNQDQIMKINSVNHKTGGVSSKTNSKKRVYQCLKCTKVFSWSDNLARHIRTIHDGLKPYVCTICNKSFSESCDLNRHTNIHSGIKQFKCSNCTKEFAVKCYLDSHISRVHRVKPYKCTTCPKEFFRLSDLKSHKLIHTGIKHFKCSTCSKQFWYKTSLQKHQRKENHNQ